VPARSRIGPGVLTAGQVEVVVVGRVRGLERRDPRVERDALVLQPRQHLGAVLAEPPQGLRGHRVPDLVPQVGVHRVDRVGDTGLDLLPRPAARVDDAAGQRGRAATGEAVQHHHGRTGRRGLDGGARAGRAEADDDHVSGDFHATLQKQVLGESTCLELLHHSAKPPQNYNLF
jgi:hypothetical protein